MIKMVKNNRGNTMDRKGVSLSLNVVIIATLALVVLIVLVVIFGNRIGLFGDATDDTTQDTKNRICATQEGGGRCVPLEETSCNLIGTVDTDWIDCSSNQKCCQRQ